MDVVRFINIKNQNFPQSSYSIRIFMMVQGCHKYSIKMEDFAELYHSAPVMILRFVLSDLSLQN